MDLAAEKRLHIAVGFREGLGRIHIGADAGEAFEIAVDETLRLGAGDAQIARKAKARDAVDHAEIDRFGLTPHIGRHLVQRHAEHLGGGGGVNILPLAEGLFQCVDPRDMGQDAQFDLGIVQGYQNLALVSHEGFSDTAPIFRPHRNVLQVRIGRGQAPGIGARDDIGGVHPPRLAVDVILQRVGIGRFQLLDLAVIQHAGGKIMGGGEVFQHLGRCRPLAGLGLFAARKPHLFEQDLAHLRGGLHVEGMAREVKQFRLKPCHFLGKGVGHPAKDIAVDLDARHLHPRQNRHQRALHRLVNRGDLGAVKLWFERLPQPPCDIGILGRIGGGLVKRHPVECDLRFARTDQLLDRDRRVA